MTYRIKHLPSSHSGLIRERFYIEMRWFWLIWRPVYDSYGDPLEFGSKEDAERWIDQPDYRL